MSLLPQELIDTIIDVLEDDIQSLRACTLVSSAFVGRAQQHLFRQVTLTGSRPTRTSRLANLLSESPHLSRAISSLRVVHKQRRTSKGYYLSPLILDRSLTDALPCIREFSLESDGLSCCTFSDVTKSALHSLCASGTIVCLTLDNITGVSLRLFDCVPALQQLHLKNMSFDQLEDFNELPSQPKKLAKLTQLYISIPIIKRLRPFFKWMLSSKSSLDLSELQNFTLIIPYDSERTLLTEQVHVISKVVEMCSQSLKELNLYPSLGDRVDDVSEISNIPLVLPDCLPQLRILHIPLQMSHWEHPERNTTFMWFCTLIGKLQTCKVQRLHTLKIRCDVIQRDPVGAFEPAYWEKIHAMMTTPSLRSLQNANITLSPMYEGRDATYAELVRLIKVEMGALNERGILHVETSIFVPPPPDTDDEL